jgi:hypothetical protein
MGGISVMDQVIAKNMTFGYRRPQDVRHSMRLMIDNNVLTVKSTVNVHCLICSKVTFTLYNFSHDRIFSGVGCNTICSIWIIAEVR